MPTTAGDSNHIYNSTTLLEMSELPRRMAIVGSGFIGLEFASMYATFGTEVTVVEKGADILKREDKDIRKEIQSVLVAKGIRFLFSSKVESVQDNKKGTTVTIRNENGSIQELDVDAVLFATGRKPNTANLALQRAGVQVNDKGFIIVDDTLRTNVHHIWAIGDVNGGTQFTYISLDDFRIIRSHLFGDKSRSRQDRKNISTSVFIIPSFAKVGLTEEEAVQDGYRIKVAKLPGIASPRARILKQTSGLFKAIVDEETGYILGCTLFGAEAAEIINIVALAMDTNQTYMDLRDRIYTHPSMTEILNDLFSQI